MPGAEPVVLNGHLRDYALADLIGVLHHRRVSGCLSVEYAEAPGALYFERGELVHARVGDVRGVRAVALAVRLPDAPFRFDPRERPPERSISASVRSSVLELLGCWLEEESPDEVPARSARAVDDTASDGVEWSAGSSGSFTRPGSRVKLAVIAACVLAAMVAGVYLTGAGDESVPATAPPIHRQAQTMLPQPTPTTESLLGPSGFGGVDPAEDSQRDTSSAAGPSPVAVRAQNDRPEPRRADRAAAAANQSGGQATDVRGASPRDDAVPPGTGRPKSATVTVVTVIENGRVVRAYVADPQPGREEFEAAALRSVRHRRAPAEKNGSEEVRVTVSRQ